MNKFFKLAGNIISSSVGFLPKIGGIAAGEHDHEVVIVKQLNQAISSLTTGFLIKGFGNTLPTVEDGDYQIVTNSDNTCVLQFRKDGAWDTDNETELATPS